ncbi:MAG: ATP-dependent 6-phosphofructokinase [Planctomycetaceae bacterium]|jgi:6-phosphofructokinase 1|nr:ATP-dependent 6-phosphofructokinase [Planctomycetaceae bacterium]
MKIGTLTGGGDCPGLNAVIRAVVRTNANRGGTTLGFLEGWRGVISGQHIELTVEATDDIISRGGTILGSSRTNPFKDDESVDRVLATIASVNLDALIAIGGDDTLGVAHQLNARHGVPTIGVPKTIDNDLSSTDVTFGFDTSINVVMEAVDRLRTTAESHRRVMVIETMGRHAGWITCFAGVSTAADYILVPEEAPDIDRMCNLLKERREAGKMYGIVIVSEGVTLPEANGFITRDTEIDEFGHVKLGGIGDIIAELIETRTGIETRVVTLGHLQRGGAPSAYDRVLGTRLGVHAARLAHDGQFGQMVSLRGTRITSVMLADAVGELRVLEAEFMDEAGEFFT